MNKSDSLILQLEDSHLFETEVADSSINSTSMDGGLFLPSSLMMRHSPLISILLCVAYALVFAIGVIGNSCVVAVVVRSPRMRTVTNYFIVNLALADLLVLIVCLPATLLSNLFLPWLLGLTMCKVVSYLQGVVVSASINTLVAVSADRFLAICYPLKCQMTRRTALRVILVIWTFSLIVASPWLFYFTLVPWDPDAPSEVVICTDVWPDETLGVTYFVVVNVCLFYLLPLLIITACYMAIYLKVWKRSIPGAGETESSTGKSLNHQMDVMMTRSKLKVAKMMIVVVVIFVLSWLPLYCVFARVKLGGPFEEGSFEESLFWLLPPIAQWLGSSNSCINPILYAFFNKKYRMGFAAIIRSRKCCGTIRYEATSTASVYYRQGTLQSRSTTRRMTRSTRVEPDAYVQHPVEQDVPKQNTQDSL